MLAVCAYLAAKIVNVFVSAKLDTGVAVAHLPPASKANSPTPRRDYAAANDKNIFEAKREDLEAAAAAAEAAKSAEPEKRPEADWANATKTDLRVRLVGTAMFSIPEYSLASIVDEGAGRKAQAELYSINPCAPKGPPTTADAGPDAPDPKVFTAEPAPCNKLVEVAEVVRIETEKVYIYNSDTNQYEYLSLEEQPKKSSRLSKRSPKRKKDRRKGKKDDDLGKGITKVGANSYEITQDEINKALGNLSSLATQARIVPAFEGGEAVGFKLFSIRPGSLYSKIGIQNGDVISSINGYPINSPDKALELYQKLKDAKEINVDLKRRGKPVTLDYSITP